MEPRPELRRSLHVWRCRSARRPRGDALRDLSHAPALEAGTSPVRQAANDEHAARENVHRHYDLGNDFYRLWLDRELVYTCAYFPSPEDTLEDAQIAKMDLVCRKLQSESRANASSKPGCGWGSLALFMARQYGVSVRAFNVSSEQIAYARSRAKDDGTRRPRRVRRGRLPERAAAMHDVFVSVGMLEHVGPG